MNILQGKLFVISAPSGAGKTTIVEALLEQSAHKYNLERVITYTTKTPRAGEIPGYHYHYITVEEFKQKIDDNFFLEWSDCYGHYYGSPRYIVEALSSGKSSILIIDRAGALQIKDQCKDVVLIWMYTKDRVTLKKRLMQRGAETALEIDRRLTQADKELFAEKAEPSYHYYVCNDEITQTILEINDIVKNELKINE